jgi:hypothetical protein
MTTALIPVLGMPGLDPSIARIEEMFPEGKTILEIVSDVLKTRNISTLARTRVALVTVAGAVIVPQSKWGIVRPKAGVHVVIRVVPGKAVLKSVLMIVVSIAAVALGQFWGLALANATGLSLGAAQGLIGLGVTVAGNLLINAILPPPKMESNEKRDTYTISGWKNPLTPNGAVPDTFGRIRRAPPFAVMPYTEIVGDWQYIRAAFVFGYGDVALSDHRIGDTDFGKYDEIEIEVREGLPGDLPLTLTPQQTLEEAIGAALTRPYPRDDEGERIDNAATEETPVTRFTASDTATISVIIGFPAGLFKMNDEGERKSLSVSIRIRHRLVGTTGWTEVVTLDVRASNQEGFYRQHTWSPAARGRYEVELTRMTNERTSAQASDRTVLVAMQSIRPEYPINMDKPMALVALRIKATHQLNGALDNYNALAARRCLDWSNAAKTWVNRATRNPAALFRYALQSAANPYPVNDTGIDLAQLADWHDFCRIKGLEFNEEVLDGRSLGDQLARIAAAGRASPRHDGVKWGVVIDRPQTVVVDHMNPRNSVQFRWSRAYLKNPDGFRVSFRDETNDYKPTERVVPWPGHVGNIKVTEEIEMPGKTNPDEIWRETRRRMHELTLRPDQYSCIQDGAARSATRGDLVMGSFDTLERTQVSAMVAAVRDRYVVLDDEVEMEAGESYAVRFRTGLTEEDTIGISVVRPVVTMAGVWNSVTLEEGGVAPTVGTILHFGKLATESRAMIVAGVEAAENFSGYYHLLDAAPEIDTLTDAEIPPAWNGRIGDEIDAGLVAPAAPRVTSIRTGYNVDDGDTNSLEVLMAPGFGNSVPPSIFTVFYRKGTTGAYLQKSVPAANGGLKIPGYARGDAIQLYATATSAAGVSSAATTPVTVIIGQRDTGLPLAPVEARVNVSGTIATPSMRAANDPNTAAVFFKRGTRAQSFEAASVIGQSAYLATANQPIALEDPSGPGYGKYRYWFASLNDAGNVCLNPVFVDADIYGPDVVTNGAFASDAVWTKTGGTTIASGVASHVAGSAGGVSEVVSVTPGHVYEVKFDITARTAGNVSMRLVGTTTNIGETRSAVGTYVETLTVPATSGTISLAALFSADAVASIDNVSMRRIG